MTTRIATSCQGPSGTKNAAAENVKYIEVRFAPIFSTSKGLKVPEIIEYGEDNLPAGPNTPTSDAILIVEGRSDVLNLLKYGIKNTVAVEGVSVPQSIGELSKKRTTTAFVDGDRGGELILKELLQVGDVDYITRAPRGKEVEDLEKEEVLITGIARLELEIKKKFGLRMIFSPNFFHFSLVPHRFRTFYYVVPHTGPP